MCEALSSGEKIRQSIAQRRTYLLEAIRTLTRESEVLNLGNNQFGFNRWIVTSLIGKITGMDQASINLWLGYLVKSKQLHRRTIGPGVYQYSLVSFNDFKIVKDYFVFNDKLNK